MATSEITVSSASNQQDWLENIAPNKFENLDKYNLLRTSLFGYVNEVFGNATENTVNMTMNFYEELFPNKARLPNSIYSYAALANYTDFNATPARMSVVIALRKQDLISLFKDSNTNNTKTFKILSANKVMVDNDVPYLLDYDIIINMVYDSKNTNYIVKCQYDMSVENSVSNITSPYLNTLIKIIEGEEYVIFQAQITQLEKIVKEFTVYEDDLVKNINYEIPYDGKLSNFDVYYKHSEVNTSNLVDTDTEILLDGYFTDASTPDSDYFYFYNYREGIIDISFSAYSKYFRPKFNSNLTVNVYTTLGPEGNFSYTGSEIEIYFGDELEDTEMKSIVHVILPNSDSVGGLDEQSLEEIQKNTCIEFSTRKNLITDQDLNIFFNESTTTDNKLVFIKKRDDVLQRLYCAFSLFYDSLDRIIPTSTHDIYIDSTTSITHPSQQYKHDIIAEGPLIFAGSAISIEDSIKLEEYNFIYRCPFVINITETPSLFATYYSTFINTTLFMNYLYVNELSLNQFNVVSLKLERNAITQPNHYSLTLETVNDVTIPNDISNLNEYIHNLVKIGVVLYDDSNPVGYFVLDQPVSSDYRGSYTYQYNLSTSNLITNDNKLCLKNIFDSNGKLNDVYVSENLKMQFKVFYSSDTDYTILDGENLVTYKDDLMVIFETNRNIELFSDLSRVINSQVKKIDNKYLIKEVPLVRGLYFENSDNIINFFDKFNTLKNLLMNNIESIQANSDFNLKFFKSYGPSKYFKLGREKIKNIKSLNISMSLNIEFQNYTDSTELETLIGEIKQDIIDFIEGSTEFNSKYLINAKYYPSQFYFSLLSKQLHTNFEKIKSIDIINLDDEDTKYQSIESDSIDIYSMNKSELKLYVPEIININKSPILKSGVLTFEPSITINIV